MRARPPLPFRLAVAAVAAAVVAGGCTSSTRFATDPPPSPTSGTGSGPTVTATPLTTAPGSGPGRTVPVTAPAPAPITGGTTVAPYRPSAPQSSPDAAAGALVQFWSTADRAGAATVAAPTAVSTLFAIAYPAGYLQARGCTDAGTDPGTCTYRNTATNGIYQFGVSRTAGSQSAGGWYVTAVTPES